MATRRVTGSGRGRIRLALVLLCFLAISSGVILRRSIGIAGARQLQELDARRAALVAERMRMEGAVRAAGSRARLQPIAEQRLQMRVPSDSQVIILPRGAHVGP